MCNLQELAELAGISSSYVDKTGQTHFTDDNVRKFFLKSMGYKTDTTQQIKASFEQLQKKEVLPPVLAFFDNETVEFVPESRNTLELCIYNEKNEIVWQRSVKGGQKVVVDDLENGYYHIRSHPSAIDTLLIRAPQKCWMPEFLQKKEHIYGTAVMLYALHSEHSMGIGDFSDLTEIVRLTAKHGGDVVGINPLGVMSPFIQIEEQLLGIKQGDYSPYRTLSRLFVNYIYLDLQQEEDFQKSPQVQEFMAMAETFAEIKRLNEADKVDYTKVLLLKKHILELMFAYFDANASAVRRTEFAEYIAAKADELDNLAVFETLLETIKPLDFWRFWPNGLTDVRSEAVAKFKKENAVKVRFYKYCHWLADRQIKKVQKLALELNMKIGLYTDMPIGAASNGTEVWENPSAYVLDAGVGAPADPMRPRGQSWGFTPYHPQQLVKQFYAPFIKLVKENMQYSGALRIDHAMGLRRLFWGFFSKDNPVVQGAYIYYNIKDLVAIITLESMRHKCLIIGEDLGTVPEGFREYMEAHGLLSYKVFCRQKEKDGSFIAPEKYMYLSLAQSSTHDQATACGFWTNEDIEVFNHCNLYVNDMQYQDNLAGRGNDRKNMLKAFEKEGILNETEKNELADSVDDGKNIPAAIELKINQYCARANSALFLVRLNDIYRQVVLDNAPGTVQEYPNWRIKMNVSVEQITASTAFVKMMNFIYENRPSVKKKGE
ncbi:MAG: 4-alpha-glucanotransferase [Pseudomonadota bacterium]|nr:4-alpha-glucanotransferase [Pseudomonadota bacterium]